MDNIFNDIDIFENICSEKQFEEATGEKVSDIAIETEVLNCKYLGYTEDTKKETDEQNNVSSKNIDTRHISIMPRTYKKSSNGFLNAVQENEIKKINKEVDRISHADMNYPYMAKEVVTNAELQLYNFMKNNLENKSRIAILPKVRLADIIDVDPIMVLDQTPFYKIAQKHVDFLICEADTLKTICVVELDDYTHNAQDRKERDEFVMRALYVSGITTKRIKTKIKNISLADLKDIDDEIYEHFAPSCPDCGRQMHLKHNGRTGHRFYACIDNQKCRRTLNIDGGIKLP